MGLMWAKERGEDPQVNPSPFNLNVLLHYQWLLHRGGEIATIALLVAPTVKAYVKTIGQPAQNVLSQMLIRMVLHSMEEEHFFHGLVRGDNNWSGHSGKWEIK